MKIKCFRNKSTLDIVTPEGDKYAFVREGDHLVCDIDNEALCARLLSEPAGFAPFDDAAKVFLADLLTAKAVGAIAEPMAAVETPLDEMSAADLRAKAKELGLDIPNGTKKSDIIIAIENATA